jgi:cytidylate kinase
MKISIAGDLGSGKSSVAKLVANELGFAYMSTGQIHRMIAEEYGVDSLELNKIASGDQSIDDRVDGYLLSLNESDQELVIDSRLAWHFVKDTFKVYLQVDRTIGAERILGDGKRLREPSYDDTASALTSLEARKQAENERFFERYAITCEDLSNYDLVINTSTYSLKEVSSLIVKEFNQRYGGVKNFQPRA